MNEALLITPETEAHYRPTADSIAEALVSIIMDRPTATYEGDVAQVGIDQPGWEMESTISLSWGDPYEEPYVYCRMILWAPNDACWYSYVIDNGELVTID